MPGTGLSTPRGSSFAESRSVGGGCEADGIGTGGGRVEACGVLVAGRGADDAYQGAGRIVFGGSENGNSPDGARRIRVRLRCACCAEAGKYSGGRGVVCAADGERAVRPGFGAGGVCVVVRGEEDAGADCAHVEDGETAEELGQRPQKQQRPQAPEKIA